MLQLRHRNTKISKAQRYLLGEFGWSVLCLYFLRVSGAELRESRLWGRVQWAWETEHE